MTRGRLALVQHGLVVGVQGSRFARWGLVTAAVMAVLGQWYLHLQFWSQIPATDVRVYAQGGRWALAHADVYAGTFETAFTGFLPFSYPPFAAVLMIPVGMLPDAWLMPVWTLASLVSLAAILALSFNAVLIRSPRRWLVIVMALIVVIPTEPISELLPFGQIGTILTLACLLDVMGRSGRLPRGVLVGLMTAVKLTPGLFIVHWFTTKQWRPALTACATTAVAWCVGALWLPESTWTYLWTQRLIVNPTARAASPALEYNQSLGGLLARLHDGDIPVRVYVPLALLLCAAGLFAAAVVWRANDPIGTAAVVGLTSVMVSPVSWSHHAVWMLPALGAVVGNGRSPRRVAVGIGLLACLYYPTRGWQPIESTFAFQEVWFVLYGLTLILLTSISWRAVHRTDRTSRPDSADPVPPAPGPAGLVPA